MPVLVAPYLSPQRQELCRKEEIGFIDLSGNVYLKFKSLFIDRMGFPNKYPVKRQGRSPFSDKASLVLRALLSGGRRLWGIRELALEIALNPGYVSRMAQEIEKRGYVKRIDSKLSLRSPDGILEDWVRSYNLKKNQLSGYFCMAESADDILHRLRKLKLPNDVQYALSVQAGANLVAPYSKFKEVHVYAKGPKEVGLLEKGMNLKPVEQGGNLVIMRPYYHNSVFYSSRLVDGLRIVSDIQLYLDLHGYPLRGLEQAEHLLEKRIRPVLEEVDDDE
ncbi:MAG: helix-turn-helix domain-containing protein [Deltaproteobacteria bacterium]|nr:helix-turn-helix domain-containing protein [Deltaproteobacteria bacterium]